MNLHGPHTSSELDKLAKTMIDRLLTLSVNWQLTRTELAQLLSTDEARLPSLIDMPNLIAKAISEEDTDTCMSIDALVQIEPLLSVLITNQEHLHGWIKKPNTASAALWWCKGFRFSPARSGLERLVGERLPLGGLPRQLLLIDTQSKKIDMSIRRTCPRLSAGAADGKKGQPPLEDTAIKFLCVGPSMTCSVNTRIQPKPIPDQFPTHSQKLVAYDLYP